MKALQTLTGAEKTRLLYDLFPDEMPAFIEDILAFCADFSERKDEYRIHWQDGFMPFNYWLNLADETAGLIKKHKNSMLKSSRVFADQLYFK